MDSFLDYAMRIRCTRAQGALASFYYCERQRIYTILNTATIFAAIALVSVWIYRNRLLKVLQICTISSL